jgi:hypothetical protein
MTTAQAQREAREGAELGDLRARQNDAAQEGRYLRFTIAKLNIQAQWKACLLAGDEDGAEVARLEGVEICNEFYGCDE